MTMTTESKIRHLERQGAVGEDVAGALARVRERAQHPLEGLTDDEVLRIARSGYHPDRARAREVVRLQWGRRPLALLAVLRDRHKTRLVLGLDRLPRGASQIEELQAQRAARQPALPESAPLERRREELRRRRIIAQGAANARMAKLVRPYYDECGYRRSTSGWAGGGHRVSIVIADAPWAEGASERAWSDNGKWSGTDSHHRLAVLRTWARRIPRAIRVVSDRLTLDARRCPAARGAERSWLATRAQQGRGVSLYAQRGRIDLLTDGSSRFVVA